MIYDAQDGTSGRHVWRLATAALPTPVHVIASTEENARTWLAGLLDPLPADLTVEDRGSADRTEISQWRDESRL